MKKINLSISYVGTLSKKEIDCIFIECSHIINNMTLSHLIKSDSDDKEGSHRARMGLQCDGVAKHVLIDISSHKGKCLICSGVLTDEETDLGSTCTWCTPTCNTQKKK